MGKQKCLNFFSRDLLAGIFFSFTNIENRFLIAFLNGKKRERIQTDRLILKN